MNEAKPQKTALHGCSVGLTSKTQALFKNMKWNRYESQQLKGFPAFNMGKTKFEPYSNEHASVWNRHTRGNEASGSSLTI